MAAPHDDASVRSGPDVGGAQVLGPASAQARLRLGVLLVATAILAVLLAAADAPAVARTPFVLVAGSLLPGYPLVARLPVDLPTLLALDVCVSLAIDASLAFAMVQAQFWHPLGLGLVLAVGGVAGAFVTLSDLRRPVAR